MNGHSSKLALSTSLTRFEQYGDLESLFRSMFERTFYCWCAIRENSLLFDFIAVPFGENLGDLTVICGEDSDELRRKNKSHSLVPLSGTQLIDLLPDSCSLTILEQDTELVLPCKHIALLKDLISEYSEHLGPVKTIAEALVQSRRLKTMSPLVGPLLATKLYTMAKQDEDSIFLMSATLKNNSAPCFIVSDSLELFPVKPGLSPMKITGKKLLELEDNRHEILFLLNTSMFGGGKISAQEIAYLKLLVSNRRMKPPALQWEGFN